MSKTRCLAALSLLLTLPMIAGPSDAAQQPASDERFTMALVGDAIITQRLSPYKEPEFLSMLSLIRNADAAFANFEMLLHDFEGYPNAQSGGTWMRGDRTMAQELAWAGFHLVSRANNHTGDYSPESMRTTSRYLDEAGIVWAGVGENLQQACEPHYLETAKARVALIACASTFPIHAMAGPQRSDVGGRPGLNPLRFTTRYVVSQTALGQIRSVAAGLKLPIKDQKDGFSFLGNLFVAGDHFEIEQRPLESDLKEILASIRDAKVFSDYVVVAVHAHEFDRDRTIPAQFLPIFAHAAIDAGADVIVGSGPHVLRGIEIYKDKPIFYSLGNFIFQNDTVLRLPQEGYDQFDLGSEARMGEYFARRYNNDKSSFPADPPIWESIIALPTFRGGKVVELKLYPITLGYGKPAGRRGRPLPADEALSKKILDDLARISQPLATKINNEKGVGVVELKPSRNTP